jgi:hypothetical protein
VPAREEEIIIFTCDVHSFVKWFLLRDADDGRATQEEQRDLRLIKKNERKFIFSKSGATANCLKGLKCFVRSLSLFSKLLTFHRLSPAEIYCKDNEHNEYQKLKLISC